MPSESTSTPVTPYAEELAAAVDAAFPGAVAALAGLVRIPSVSWDGYERAAVQQSAEHVASLARETGVFDDVRVLDAPVSGTVSRGMPAVLARREARHGRPTVLLYAHHDVQPEGDPEGWASAPFEPTLRGDRLFGRGAADDGAGVVAHLTAVRLLSEHADPELGLVLFIEGEEESGSPSFGTFLAEHRDELEADVILVADSGNWDLDTPALTVRLRGMAATNVTISTLDHALHSGMYGGAVPDAMLAAIRTLDTLWNADGSVAVSGLMSLEADTPPYDEARLREEAAPLGGTESIGVGTILSRIWNRPSITVTGIDAPSVRNASNTLIPSVRLRLSVRVAPGQSARDAADHVETHLRAHAAFGAHLDFAEWETGEAFLVDTDGPAVTDALATMHEGWGRAPVLVGAGGSIPFIADLSEVYPHAEILVTGVEDPDSRAHSPNESVHLPTLKRAILSELLLLARLNSRA